MKNEVAIFQPSDLTAAGISSQLTSNDLVEVVAHDIYDKFINSINEAIKRSAKLREVYLKLMDFEINKMKKSLLKHLSLEKDIETVSMKDIEDDFIEKISCSFGTSDEYWNRYHITSIKVTEKERGTIAEQSAEQVGLPNLKLNTVRVKLVITTGNNTTVSTVKTGSITGEIKTSVQKTFVQVVSVPTTRFVKYAEDVSVHNKEVTALLNFLPKNGGLSVERFTREARVKMNKKMLSAQSPEFKKKISELFNITL